MKTQSLFRINLGAALLVTLLASPLHAQLFELKPKVRVGVSLLQGIEANFSQLGDSGFVNDPGPATGGAEERFYDDGFNRVDISGNAGDLTSFWSYDNGAQYDGSAITLSSTGTTGSGAVSEDDDLAPGLEIAVDLPFNFDFENKLIDEIGVSFAVQWHRIDINNRSTITSDAILVEDRFSTNGAMPPGAPYTGSFTGPGFLLDSTPSRSITNLTGGGSVAGSRSVDADLFSLNVGPYARFKLSDQFAVRISAGAVFSYIESRYEVESRSFLGAAATGNSSGSDDDGDFLLGLYASGGVEYAITERTNLQIDLGFRQTEDFKQQAGGSEAELDFSAAMFINVAYSLEF